MKTASVLGLQVHNVTIDEALDRIDSLIKEGGGHLVVTLGVEMAMRARKDREFFDLVNRASLVTPDSVGILWACKYSGTPLKERVPGIDMLYSCLRQSKKYPWRLFFLGAKPEVVEKAVQRVKEEYPEANVVGWHDGYFKDDTEVIEKINEVKPDVLFIAMGSPAQEKWFMKNREKLGDLVAVGVGGSLDVVSGTVKRAPIFYQKMGIEWLYRFITQPSRFGRMFAIPHFVITVIADSLFRKKSSQVG